MQIEKKTFRRVLVGVIFCILVYWLLHETARARSVFNWIIDVFSPFIIGASIAFVLNVPMRGYENLLKKVKKKSLRRILSITLTFISVALVLTLVFLLLIPQLGSAIRSLIPSVNTFLLEAESFFTRLIQNNEALIQWGADKANLQEFNWSTIVERIMGILGKSVETIFYGLFDTLSGILSGMFDAVIAIVFSMYCLFQKETLARQGRKIVYAFLPEKAADKTVEIVRLSSETFSNFLSGQCIEVCILGSLFAICMAIFDMPYIALISVLIAVTAFVPVVGAWIGCVFGAFFIFVNDVHDPMQAVWFVIMFVILQQIENNMIYPRVVGTSIGLSGMWVLLAVGVGGELLGVGGMFIMIPVTSVIYTILRDVCNKRLAVRDIDDDKLQVHPPAIRSRFRRKVKISEKKESDSKTEE